MLQRPPDSHRAILFHRFDRAVFRAGPLVPTEITLVVGATRTVSASCTFLVTEPFTLVML